MSPSFVGVTGGFAGTDKDGEDQPSDEQERQGGSETRAQVSLACSVASR